MGAVKVDAGHAWVYLIEDGKAVKTEVGLGLSDGQSVQVVRGLTADQMVALTNVSLLTDGSPVKVVP
jgi:predicted cupin superfamily sugar epimerase